ncbi:hypothetical protein H8S75_04950 [Hungatella sp. L12]|uniref:Transposase n=1 Tax=Hungatella hominis TaxID=2763050 RepID=A0ABR7H285_9FIRM|nr:hypothetical protein [Hungatella hominis]MBC5707300.1 hypothetical protein [Hungatella hominis]
MRQININRNYKDRLFRLAFQEKGDLLDLYNAVSGRQYTNPDDLIITTLADAIYLGMKNDISFLVSDVLNLYEHQSSFNPNMPVRGLNYFADTYREYIDRNELDIYGEKLIRLPMPQYIVFYNGTKEEPDRVELRLSDAFLCQYPEENGCLECRAIMININYGHNKELMDRCKRLKDYAVFVNRIRDNEKGGMSLNEAVELAVNSCINEGILADILKKNRAEVCNLILYEYDEQKQLAIAREGAKKAGREEGREEGRKEGRKEGREQGIAQGREAEKVIVIRNMAAKGLDPRSIADILNTEESYVKNVLNLLAEKVGKTDLEIAGILLNRNKTDKNP